MTKSEWLKIGKFCKSNMNRELGHDYSHAIRTRSWTTELCKREGIANTAAYEVAGLLHDIGLGLGDRSIHGEVGSEMVREFLIKENILTENERKDIVYAIKWHNKKFLAPKITQILKILTDADTLDLLGAVGIWRGLIANNERIFSGKLNEVSLKKKSGDYDRKFSSERVDNSHTLLDQLHFQIASYDTLLTDSAKEYGAPLVNFLKKFRYMLWKELDCSNFKEVINE